MLRVRQGLQAAAVIVAARLFSIDILLHLVLESLKTVPVMTVLTQAPDEDASQLFMNDNFFDLPPHVEGCVPGPKYAAVRVPIPLCPLLPVVVV